MQIKEKEGKKTVSIRNIMLCGAAVMLVLSALLLAATWSMAGDYANLNANIKRYARWQLDANSLQSGSDYLTEQVRCFVVTGDRAYLDNYFEEANVTRSRDRAVENVRLLVGENEAYASLVSALGESVDLMDREYYAMRLTVGACGYDLSEYPAEIQNVMLSAADRAAPREEQRETARSIVFDEVYHGKKEAISGNIRACLDVMNAEMEERQTDAQLRLQRTLTMQRIMIVLSILFFTAAFLLFLHLVVKPLLKAVTYIEKDQSIPIEGAKEFRFLAKAYNLMHRTNQNQKKEL